MGSVSRSERPDPRSSIRHQLTAPRQRLERGKKVGVIGAGPAVQQQQRQSAAKGLEVDPRARALDEALADTQYVLTFWQTCWSVASQKCILRSMPTVRGGVEIWVVNVLPKLLCRSLQDLQDAVRIRQIVAIER